MIKVFKFFRINFFIINFKVKILSLAHFLKINIWMSKHWKFFLEVLENLETSALNCVMLVISDENRRLNVFIDIIIVYSLLTKSRAFGFWSFFEYSIFLQNCEEFCLFPHRLGVYIPSCHPVVLCVYIISSVRLTSLFMMVHSPTSFKAPFCTWWYWSYLLSQPSKITLTTKYTLVSLRVISVLINSS